MVFYGMRLGQLSIKSNRGLGNAHKKADLSVG